MSNEYTRNHFVPKGYLKGFATPHNEIYRLKINPESQEKPITKKGIKSVGFEWDLYTIKNQIVFKLYNIPNDEKFIEKNCFKEIENKINGIIENIENQNLGKEERELICDFILISITRNPRNIEVFKQQYDESWHLRFLEKNKEEIKKTAKTYNDERPFEEIKKEYLDHISKKEEFTIDNLAQSSLHQSLLKLALDPNNQRKLIFRHNIWRQFTIYENEGNIEFITSNYPAYSFQNGIGFNDNLLPTSSYVLPLNKRMMLEISGPPMNEKFYTQPKWVKIDNKGVDSINYLGIRNSHGEVYSSNRELLERYNSDEFNEIHEPKFEELLKKNKNRT